MFKISMMERDFVRSVLDQFYKNANGSEKILILKIKKRLGV